MTRTNDILIASSGADSPSPVLMYRKHFLVGMAGLLIAFVYGILPDSVLALVPLYIALTILSVFYPRFPLYYMVLTLTFGKFFQTPDFTIYGSTIGESFRFANHDAAVIKYADELAFILCMQQLLVKTNVFTRLPPLFRSIRIGRYILLFGAVVLFSALLNSVPFTNILYFFTNWFRPFLLLAVMTLLSWTERQIAMFLGLLITLAFAFQWGGSLAVNWQRALTGEFFWIDDFTGTFMFPLCEWAAFLLAIALFVFLSEFFVSKNGKYLLYAGLALFGIISAQVGTMTAMLLLILALFFGALFFAPNRFGLSGFKGRTGIVFGLLSITVVFALVLVGAPASEGQAFAIGYAQSQFNKWVLDVVSILDIPKVLAYYKLSAAFLNGEINPLWGAGPAMYLTGMGTTLNVSPLVEKYSAGTLFGGIVGEANSQAISVVGLLGELGILGFALYVALLVVPFRALWRRRHLLFGTRWHGLFLGTIGSFAFLLAYATIQTALDAWIQVTYPLSFCGGLLIISCILDEGRSYQPWRTTDASI